MLSAVYGRNQKEQATAIEMLLSHCDLAVQDAEVAPAALELFRVKPAPVFPSALCCRLR